MLKDLAKIIADMAGKNVVYDLPNQVESEGPSKAIKARLDNTKLNNLGWKAKYNVQEGLERPISILKIIANIKK